MTKNFIFRAPLLFTVQHGNEAVIQSRVALFSTLRSNTSAALLLLFTSHQLDGVGYKWCLFTQHKRVLISFHFIIVCLNLSRKLDLYLTCHIDPHTVCTDQRRERPRPSIQKRVPVDFANS